MRGEDGWKKQNDSSPYALPNDRSDLLSLVKAVYLKHERLVKYWVMFM
jgi:hypothetical protein